ncbi:HEPN domain-containing protein [Bartonella sp. LJL80]
MEYDADQLQEKLKHLPLRKRRELAYIAKVLFEEFEQAQSKRRLKAAPKGRILKLVLYGSYARGDYVEDRIGGYFSDFDLLVVVDKERYAGFDYWYDADKRLSQEYVVTKRIKTPAEPIVHSISHINKQLNAGRPFFLDILRDGIVLYDGGGRGFTKPGNMSDEQKHEEAQKYFDEWFPLSQSALKGAKFHFYESKGKMGADMRMAAFLAHQATEHTYNCLLLTLKLYSPKMHNIWKLRDMGAEIAPELIAIWPRNKRLYKRSFERLVRAYVEARYSQHYEITAEELKWLFERIELLQAEVKTICETHLAAGR